MRALVDRLKEHGQIPLAVDQPVTVGALPVAVARAEGVLVAYLPRLAQQLAGLHVSFAMLRDGTLTSPRRPKPC